MHVGMSERFLERDDLEAAVRHLDISKAMGEHLGSRQDPYRWRVAMARVRLAQGDPAGALALLDDAERLYVADFYPRVRPISALRARVLIDARKVGRGARLGAGGRSVDRGRSRLCPSVRARHPGEAPAGGVRRDGAGQSLTAALALLDRLLEPAVAGGRMGLAIEIFVLQALAHQIRGDVEAALVPLARALVLAEPEGYVRAFLDEGPPMATLLESLREGQGSSAYVDELLTRFGRGVRSASVSQDLVEPLSARELEVLRLLATDLDGPGIARELVVSLSTIRSHTKAIYAKLGVTNRRAAVRRGEELDLLSRAGRPPDRAIRNT